MKDTVEFDANVTPKDLFNFKLYHNYHSFGGIMSTLFGIIALVIFAVTVKNEDVNISYKLMMLFFGCMFTICQPVSMFLKTKQQMKTMKAFMEPVRYIVTEDKIVLKQADISEELLWDDIYKIKFTGKSIAIYLTNVRANIIPISDIRGKQDIFIKIAEKKLKPFQICINKTKLSKA